MSARWCLLTWPAPAETGETGESDSAGSSVAAEPRCSAALLAGEATEREREREARMEGGERSSDSGERFVCLSSPASLVRTEML